LFEDADVNLDGSISFGEAYELVLKMYVFLNREAPLPPPTRGKFFQLYSDADKTRNDRLNQEEFKGLAHTLARRALWRLVAHKLVTLVGAPVLAEYLVRTLAGKEWLPHLAYAIVPDRFKERVIPIITSTSFGRTVLVVLLVATLGNTVMNSVNSILDMSLPNEERDEQYRYEGSKLDPRRVVARQRKR
jgi:hypothetical protein